MKAYKSSDLTHKRSEVLKEAAESGVIIQQLETNGKVRQEFVLISRTQSSISSLLQLIDNGKW